MSKPFRSGAPGNNVGQREAGLPVVCVRSASVFSQLRALVNVAAVSAIFSEEQGTIDAVGNRRTSLDNIVLQDVAADAASGTARDAARRKATARQSWREMECSKPRTNPDRVFHIQPLPFEYYLRRSPPTLLPALQDPWVSVSQSAHGGTRLRTGLPRDRDIRVLAELHDATDRQACRCA